MIHTEVAPAKVNLTLHVTGQRSDGYHVLDSLVVFTNTGDRISLGTAPGLTLTGPEATGLQSEPDNLVLRAARLMGLEDAALVLDKELPVSSGIGGGSTDAAATLRLLARVTNRAVPPLPDQLGLGADVPVCVPARPARMQGIGEQLSPVPALPPLWMVLVNPRMAVSTPAVFRAMVTRQNPPMPDILPPWRDFQDLAQWVRSQRNDLEAPASLIAPAITKVLHALRAQPDCALARMSGSGATCFGLFASQTRAEHAAQVLQAAQLGWWVRATGLHQAL